VEDNEGYTYGSRRENEEFSGVNAVETVYSDRIAIEVEG
jgi:hypothetical protein